MNNITLVYYSYKNDHLNLVKEIKRIEFEFAKI